MKGLLRKDWYMMTRYARILLLFVVIYGVSGIFFEEMSSFTILPAMLMSLLPVTLYAYDEREKWTVCSQAFPVSRAQYVTAKYLLGLCAIAVYFAVMTALRLAFAAAGVRPLDDMLGMLGVQFFVSFLAPSILMPILFRFGMEKGRIVYFILVGGLFMGTMMLTDGGSEMPSQLALPEWAIGLLPLVIYALSWRLSVFLYNRRKL
ncbi:MAG: ABC-2 transporter permease [Ruminococcaceae bacterium]|nr:ABC-2 transporter permease [Oscillospiraceae bacterium]